MAITASWQDTGAHPLAPAGGSMRRPAFAAARRHTRAVRVLRALLPVAGLLALGGFVVKAHFELPGNLDLTAASMSVTRNSIIMDRPHLTGFDGDSREYSLLADRAIQPLTNPGQVRLESIEAKVSGEEGATSITAEAGEYDHQKSTLQLLGAIAVNSAEGYVLRMTDAYVDFGAGTLVSEHPIAIGYGASEVTGGNLAASDGGNLIVIEGGVRTVIMPPKSDAAATATPATE